MSDLQSVIPMAVVPDLQQSPPSKGVSVFIFGDLGCLDGETTRVKYSRSRRGSREITLKNLYRRFHGLPIKGGKTGRTWTDLTIPVRLHSITEDGHVFYNEISDVLYSGVKPCVKVTANDGSWLICTMDHKFLTSDYSYTRAHSLLGMEVLMIGSMRVKSCGGKQRRKTGRKSVSVKYHPGGCLHIVHARARMRVPRDYAYKQLHKARLVVEADMNGLSYGDFIDILNKNKKKSLSLQYLSSNLEVHHKDEDHTNDELENLQVLTKSAHASLHGSVQKTVQENTDYCKKVRITSVESVGERETYDITMSNRIPNFPANGFFVHNSWKTSWCAQWPGVIFLSINVEGGDESLKVYPQIAKYLCEKSQMKDCPPVFNMGVPPVFEIMSCGMPQARTLGKNVQWFNCFNEAIDGIVKHGKSWGICTVVVDSLTYLIDLWIEELMQHRYKSHGHDKWKDQIRDRGGELMGPPEWNLMNMYFRSARVRLAGLGLNVIWTALEQEIRKQNPKVIGESDLVKIIPQISGQTKVKLPGQCNLHIHAQKNFSMDMTKMGRQKTTPTFWTSPDSKVQMIRHRYGFAFPEGRLNDPEWGDVPTFRAVWNELHPYIYIGQQ